MGKKNKKQKNKMIAPVSPIKLDFKGIDAMQNALYFAFYPDGMPDKKKNANHELDNRFFSVWNHFVLASGWTEEEYWAEVRNHSDDHDEFCEACKKENEDQEINLLPDTKKKPPDFNMN